MKRPSLGIQWLVCANIEVDIEHWRKAEKSQSAYTKYLQSEEEIEVQNKIVKLEGLIRTLFDEKVIKSADDRHILDEAISAFACEDARKVLDEIEQRKKSEEDNKIHVIWNYHDYFMQGISDGTILQKSGAKEYREATVKSWREFDKYLREYVPKEMTFEQITKKFADGFVIYLQKKGLLPKTVNKLLLSAKHHRKFLYPLKPRS